MTNQINASRQSIKPNNWFDYSEVMEQLLELSVLTANSPVVFSGKTFLSFWGIVPSAKYINIWLDKEQTEKAIAAVNYHKNHHLINVTYANGKSLLMVDNIFNVELIDDLASKISSLPNYDDYKNNLWDKQTFINALQTVNLGINDQYLSTYIQKSIEEVFFWFTKENLQFNPINVRLFKKRQSFDYYYQSSNDGRVFRRGAMEYRWYQELIKQDASKLDIIRAADASMGF